MSKVAIQGNASGTGTLTIAAPNTNTDRTLTLPDSAGTVDTLQRAGNVLQVVQGTTNTSVTTTGTTYIDTGLSASITPTSASSKVLVLVTHQGWITSDNALWVKIVRASTDILENKWVIAQNQAETIMTTFAMSYLDSPATTSATTYKTMFKSRDSGEEVGINRENVAPGTIILMEIAA